MTDMRRILERKGHQFYSVPTRATVGDAVRELATHHIGAVLVMDEGQLRGVFSERDAVRVAAQRGQFPSDLTVGEVMTRDVCWVTPDTTVDECMALMTKRRFRHVPVMVDTKVVGIVSIGDIVLEALTQRETTIRGLETYIVGGDYLP